MNAVTKGLADDAARCSAMAIHNRSLLVEAGAGSGKTAILAGRIAMLLAEGVAPKAIAAVTFTELAASELLMRVRDFVRDLIAGQVPPELLIVLPAGLSKAQRSSLASSSSAIDEITCSTIHGFCQRLIKPYPVEANIDPGATVMDRNQADLAFTEISENWLRERLSSAEGGVIAELVLEDPAETVGLIHKILDGLRRSPAIKAPPGPPLLPAVGDFRDRAVEFAKFIRQAPAAEEETSAIAARFEEMANAVTFALTAHDPADLVRVIVSRPHPSICTRAGAFSAFNKKGKWVAAAMREGLAKPDGELLYVAAESHYEACCSAWHQMLQSAASNVLASIMAEVSPVIQRFHDHKRATAVLDFDDLIFAARNLLRDHDEVRRALANRYAHVLVDEFQDTDPLQMEIFWRLCGEPQSNAPLASWAGYQIRPGALFLVGDPKQAIYRFRGADVMAYIRARDAFKIQDSSSVLSISTNFRSCASILAYVNERFKAPLSCDGQPGFIPLDHFHSDRSEGLCVAALDVAVAVRVERRPLNNSGMLKPKPSQRCARV